MKNIEPRILPLVTALNKLPFLTTYCSCEGHFVNGNDQQWAEVRFRGEEEPCQQFAQWITKEFSTCIPIATIPITIKFEIENCFFNILSNTGKYWILRLTPLADNREEKRAQANMAIGRLCMLIKMYKTIYHDTDKRI